MQCCAPFYVRDLSRVFVSGTWRLEGLAPTPVDTEGRVNLSFSGVKGYIWIFDCMELAPLTPALFKGEMYFEGKDSGFADGPLRGER